MGISFDREETADQIIIRWSRILPFYIGFIAVIFFVIILPFPEIFKLLILFAPSAVQLYDTREIRPEIARAKARGALEISGKRFSFNKPYTVIIDKHKL